MLGMPTSGFAILWFLLRILYPVVQTSCVEQKHVENGRGVSVRTEDLFEYTDTELKQIYRKGGNHPSGE